MHKGWVRWTVILIVGAMVLALLVVAGAGARGQEECPAASQLTEVPGAEFFQVTCLDDLTTLSNPRIDLFTYGWGGSGNRQNSTLSSQMTELGQTPVPGVQIEGWFPDSCSRYEIEHNTFMPTCEDGHRRNGQFVIRVPDDWDGRHLVVAGAPGLRTQFANDIILSDRVLEMGWAYAAHDKGNTGLNFFRAGDDETDGEVTTWTPPKAIEQWGGFMALAADAAQGVLVQLRGAEADLTYAMGISNGGYQVRLALERYPERFDGGVDWEGTLFTPEGPNLYTTIPPLLRGFPPYEATGDRSAFDEIVHGGTVPPDSEPIWEDHYAIYWGTVASTYRPVVDPEYSSYVDAPQLVVPPQHPDAQYDYASRPDVVRERVARLSNTGVINGRPLITLHGTLDALLPIASDSDVYSQMVRDAGFDEDFRYYVVERGTHVDTAADDFPDDFRPILPCFWQSISALDAWVVDGVAAPPSGFIGFDADATPEARANECGLPERVDRVAGADRVATAASASQRTFGVTRTVVLAPAGDPYAALVATPLAASLDAPVLLVDPDGAEPLGAPVERELDRMGVFEAIVVGDVGQAATTRLGEREIAVEQLPGTTPPEVAAAVADRLLDGTGAVPRTAYVASAESFADTLSAAAVAAGRGSALLLTDPAGLSPEAAAALDRHGVTDTVVVGGPLAVADEVLADLPSPTRVSGPNRYATSVAVVEHGRSRGLGVDEAYLATGAAFPDAVSAAPVAAAGEWGAPPRGMVLLVHGSAAANGSPESHAWLADNADAIERALLFGGTSAISEAVEARIREALD